MGKSKKEKKQKKKLKKLRKATDKYAENWIREGNLLGMVDESVNLHMACITSIDFLREDVAYDDLGEKTGVATAVGKLEINGKEYELVIVLESDQTKWLVNQEQPDPIAEESPKEEVKDAEGE